MKKHNYSAGPCILPQEVFEKSAQAILNFNDSGLSLLEISHRSKDFVAVMDEARAIVLELLGLEGKGYQALFLAGGASLEFIMAPYNLMKEGGKAAYLDTGTWAGAAIKEAKLFGDTVVVASSKEEILGKTGRMIPSMLDYTKHIKAESMYNTPPVFPVYASLLTLQWLKNLGGIAAIEKINNAKAALLYTEIDRNPLFKGAAAVEDRSNMNATFLLNDETHAATFDAMWKAAGISGLPGHRSVGGYRASMYNALPLESVQVLVDVMQELERTV